MRRQKYQSKNQPSKEPELTEIKVDLDSFDLDTEQGFAGGVQIVRLDIFKGGKRQTVWIDLYQHGMREAPTVRMTVVGRTRDVTRIASIVPWTQDATLDQSKMKEIAAEFHRRRPGRGNKE